MSGSLDETTTHIIYDSQLLIGSVYSRNLTLGEECFVCVVEGRGRGETEGWVVKSSFLAAL